MSGFIHVFSGSVAVQGQLWKPLLAAIRSKIWG
jgi:hypothetical protein